MPQKLPKGWVKANLGELFVPSRVRVLPAEAESLPYVGLEHIESQTMRLLGHDESADLRSSSLRFNKGDVLYGKMRPYLNKVWVAEFDGLCSAEFLIFPKTEGLNSQFLAYRLNAQDFVAFANLNVSGERPRVDFEKLSDFTFWLAPSRAQDRIIAKLDALLSRVATGEVAARRALDRLKGYRAAVLHDAVTGELTAKWRKTHNPEETGAKLLKRMLRQRRAYWERTELKRLKEAGKSPKDNKWKKRYSEPLSPKLPTERLPRGWSWASLDQLCPVFVDSAHRTPKYGKSGIPAIGPRDVVGGVLDLEQARRVSKSEFAIQTGRRIPQAGDIVYSRELSLGWGAIVNTGQDLCLSQGMCLFRPHAHMDSKLFLSFLNDSWGRDQALRAASGTAHPHLNLNEIKTLAFPLSPIEEQVQIRSQIERRIIAAEKLAITLDRQLNRAAAARLSLIAQAFTGKLVPQDPKDEPAVKLLERIRVAREAETEKPKVKRMPKHKLKAVETLDELLRLIDRLGAPKPERLLLAAGLSDDVERFFDLLRAGRDQGTLIVPVGKGAAIKKAQHAN